MATMVSSSIGSTPRAALSNPISINFDTYSAVSGGGDYDFYYTNGSNFYGYSVEKQQSEKIFNWLNCDVNGSNVNILNVDENGTVTCWLNEWNDKDRTSSIDLITVSKVPYDSVPHKESITLAAIYLDYDVQDMIVKFNRSNDQYRIEVRTIPSTITIRTVGTPVRPSSIPRSFPATSPISSA